MILINEPQDFPPAALEMLRRAGPVHLSTTDYPLADIRIVFSRLRERLGEDFHRRHPALEWLVTPTTGLNHLDMDYFSKAGVKVISLRGRTEFLSNIHATGEHTLALSLALLRKVPQAQAGVGRGEWNRYDYKGRELFGKRVFLLGYGRLGRQVAGLFSAFGCDVRAYDSDRGKIQERMFIALEEGLATADIVSLHVSLDETTQGLLSFDLLRLMKPDAFFINTARGELLDQNALLDMLEEGRLAGAALDVLRSEPDPMDNRLKKLMGDPRINLVITPHIGGFTVESLQAVELYVAELLLAELGLPTVPA